MFNNGLLQLNLMECQMLLNMKEKKVLIPPYSPQTSVKSNSLFHNYNVIISKTTKIPSHMSLVIKLNLDAPFIKAYGRNGCKAFLGKYFCSFVYDSKERACYSLVPCDFSINTTQA